MAEKFIGKYKLEKSENFDGYMKELGVNLMMRSLAQKTKNNIEIKQENGKWVNISTSPVKTTTVTWNFDEPFEQTTPDGRLVKTLITLVDGKIVAKQTPVKAGQVESTIIREIDDDGALVFIFTANGVSAVRKYVREA